MSLFSVIFPAAVDSGSPSAGWWKVPQVQAACSVEDPAGRISPKTKGQASSACLFLWNLTIPILRNQSVNVPVQPYQQRNVRLDVDSFFVFTVGNEEEDIFRNLAV